MTFWMGRVGPLDEMGMVEGGREAGQADPGPGPGMVHVACSLAEGSVGTCSWGSREDGGQFVGEHRTSLHSWAFGSNPPQKTSAKEPLWTVTKGVRPGILTNIPPPPAPVASGGLRPTRAAVHHASNLCAGKGGPGVQAAEALWSQSTFLRRGWCSRPTR